MSKMKKAVKISLCILFACGILLSLFAVGINAAVCLGTQDRILDADALLELEGSFDFIMVLGCKVGVDGTPSHMLHDRVMTGVSLYEAGVSDKLLFSGDSQSPSTYDEVGAMRALAEREGVPTDAILLDPLGLSTYDSVYRAQSELEGKRIVIVTQEYHLYRALHLAGALGIEAYGVSADLRSYRGQIKYDLREMLARCKDFALGVFQPKPQTSDEE